MVVIFSIKMCYPYLVVPVPYIPILVGYPCHPVMLVIIVTLVPIADNHGYYVDVHPHLEICYIRYFYRDDNHGHHILSFIIATGHHRRNAVASPRQPGPALAGILHLIRQDKVFELQ